MSFAYLLSCKPESISGHNYIEPNKRFDFWLNRFCEEFIDSCDDKGGVDDIKKARHYLDKLVETMDK